MAVRLCSAEVFAVLCAISVSSLCGFIAAARQNAVESTPPPQQQSQLLATSISGHVYRADTGAPLSGAIVTLFKVPVPAPEQPNIPEWQAARTKADGSYSVSADSGLYHIEAKRSGFAKGVAPPVAVAVGQTVLVGDFRLQTTGSTSSSVQEQSGRPVNQDAATGSISGSVYDQDGVAIEDATVASTCGTTLGRGPQPGIHLTDGHGNFTLSGLSPGDCYISAAPDSDMAIAGYQGAFYPNAKTRETAKPLSVKAGEENRDVRITLPYFPIFDITVKVVENAGAAPQSRYMIDAVPGDISQRVPVRRHLFPLITGPDGVAVLRGMTPGIYTVRIIPASVSAGGVGMAGPPVGTGSVQVTNSNVSISIPVSVFPNSPR